MGGLSRQVALVNQQQGQGELSDDVCLDVNFTVFEEEHLPEGDGERDRSCPLPECEGR